MAGKSEIVARVAAEVEGLTKKQAAEAVDAVFRALSDELAKGQGIVIPGFGSFRVFEQAARTGRNPATGQVIQIGRLTKVRFKAGARLARALRPAGLFGDPTSDYPGPGRERGLEELAGDPTTDYP